MLWTILFSVFIFALPVHADPQIKSMDCHYAFMSAPMAEVQLGFQADGSPERSAHITMQGQSHYETVTPEKLAPGELVHAWLSKENPENTIELIVYRTRGTQGQSKLVNAKMPMGKEIWGDCVFAKP